MIDELESDLNGRSGDLPKRSRRNKITVWSTAIATIIASATGLLLGVFQLFTPDPNIKATHHGLEEVTEQLSGDLTNVEKNCLDAVAEAREDALAESKDYTDRRVASLEDFVTAFLAGQQSLRGSRPTGGGSSTRASRGAQELLKLLSEKSKAETEVAQEQKKNCPPGLRYSYRKKECAMRPLPQAKVRKAPSLEQLQQKGK